MNTSVVHSTGIERAPYRSPSGVPRLRTPESRRRNTATELSTRRGCLRTTTRPIAEASGVSVETAYAQGSQSAILLASVDRLLTGTGEGVTLIETAPVAKRLERKSAAEVIHGLARALPDIAARAAGPLVALRMPPREHRAVQAVDQHRAEPST